MPFILKLAANLLLEFVCSHGAAQFTVRSTPNFTNTNEWNRTGSHDCSELFWLHLAIKIMISKSVLMSTTPGLAEKFAEYLRDY